MHDDPGGSDPGAAAAWLAGGGEMGERIRASTGPRPPSAPRHVAAEPAQRRQHPAAVEGADLPVLGTGADQALQRRLHPGAGQQASRRARPPGPRGVERDLGRPGPACWTASSPPARRFAATDHPFYLDRHGFAEETYFDVSYDPVRDETGKVGGVFCIVSETTGRVLSERRLRTLRDLGRAKEGRSAGGGVPPGAARAGGQSRRTFRS